MPDKDPASPEKTPEAPQEKPDPAVKPDRQEKLAEALRANLKRRKQAARKAKES